MHFNNKKKIFIFDKNILNLIKSTSNNELGRSRQNLHKNYSDKIQEMIINFKKNSYVEPHCFLNKKTVFRLIDGEFIIKIYNKLGGIKRKIKLSKKNDILIIPAKTIYDIQSKKNNSIIQELMDGPFDKKLFLNKNFN